MEIGALLRLKGQQNIDPFFFFFLFSVVCVYVYVYICTCVCICVSSYSCLFLLLLPKSPCLCYSLLDLFTLFLSVCCCRYFFLLKLCRHPLQRLFVDSSFAWRCRQTDPVLLRLVSSYFMIRHKKMQRSQGEQDGRARAKKKKLKKKKGEIKRETIGGKK